MKKSGLISQIHHILKGKLFKEEPTEKENLHSLINLILRETGKMISHMDSASIRPQLVSYTKVIFSMGLNQGKESYTSMKVCTKVLSRITILTVREL
jgi:hypothetical protein